MTHPMRMNTVDFRNLRQCAVELARDGVLNDPSDTQMLVAAAELTEAQHGKFIDIDLLDPYDIKDIVNHYDKATDH